MGVLLNSEAFFPSGYLCQCLNNRDKTVCRPGAWTLPPENLSEVEKASPTSEQCWLHSMGVFW